MPVFPNPLEKLLFFNLNLGPGPVVDIFSAVAFRLVLAGIRLEVFDTLQAHGPLSSSALAHQCGLDPRGAQVLLGALEALGYIRLREGRYANTPMTSRWMVKDRPDNIRAGFLYWDALLAGLYTNLEDSLRSGQAPQHLYEWIEGQPEVSAVFQDWMVGAARVGAAEIIAKARIHPGARRLADIGGGHATYSLAFCQRYPQLSAVVIDSPQALNSARHNLAGHPAAGRVLLQPANFMTDDLGTGYDVALLFNILHGGSPEENQHLLDKVSQALNPGGQIIVVEQLARQAPGPATRAMVRILEVSYYHLINGRLYSRGEITRWMQQAGFPSVKLKDLRTVPGTSLMVATR